MEKIKVEYSHDETVAGVRLDDGKGNILDHVMMDDLQELISQLSARSNLKLVTFEGAGRNFCFGASVEEHRKEYVDTMLRQFHELFFSLKDLSVPMLAKVSGQCLGGGMELALMCHFVFADKTAVFGQPEIMLGVVAPVASIILPEKIGLAKAEDMLLTGRSVTAVEAKTLGFVNDVFDDRVTLDAGANAWIVKNILPKSASSLRFAVKSVRVKFNHVLGNFLPSLENMYISQLMETHDANEGIHSFLEKRKPAWAND